MTNLDALQKAIEIVGGQTNLAHHCKTSQQRVWNWLHRDKAVPAEYVIRIEIASGVKRHELRPDLYPLTK